MEKNRDKKSLAGQHYDHHREEGQSLMELVPRIKPNPAKDKRSIDKAAG